jgi:hypothetical protein
MTAVGVTHHVQLGGHYYLVRPGSYLKKDAPQFGARFSTGDPDWNNLSMWQHWAQKCFIGGADQDLFADDAMFDEGIGLDTTDHEKVTLSRNLLPGSGANWAVGAAGVHAAAGFKSFVYNSKLYCMGLPASGDEVYLWEYDPATDGWVRKTSLDSKNICARSVAVYDGKVFIGGNDSVTHLPKVIYDDGALTSWTTLANPAGVGTQTVYAMFPFQQKLYVAYGTKIWRLKGDETWDGSTVFYTANASSASNYITSMEVHLGFLYMLSQNAHVHRTDGNSTFDIWNWDGQSQGVSIRSFDGRLFVLTFEFTNTADVGYGCLYQLSGSAMTQLKRWGHESYATRIGNMIVYDRRMWYGASNLLGFGNGRAGFGVACYDPIEDAHSIAASNSDTTTYVRGAAPYINALVDDQCFFGGFLFAFVRGYGAFKTPYKPNDDRWALKRFDITAAGVSLAATNGGWLTSSTYDAGTPGVKKLWRKIIVDCTTPALTGVVVEYSIDNGTSWVLAGTVSAQGARAPFSFFLNNVSSTSFKLRITLRSTSATASPTLYGFVVSYLPIPEPNWMWSFTIVLSEQQTLLDGSVGSMNTESELAFLSGLERAKALVTFTDAEGGLWASGGQPGVMIYGMSVALRDLGQPLEGEVTVTLLEAVETY